MPSLSVVIPAYNAERTLGRVLESLAAQDPPVEEVLVVDDGSTDGTAALAERYGVTLVRPRQPGSAGGARNAGWDAAGGDVVVFLDADAVPGENWSNGLRRALREFPGAIVGCARRFNPRTNWGWVAHLQVESPYLARGEPRETQFVSSYCLAVPRSASLRWDESYGGEDALFCVAALAQGFRLVFDPRFHAVHEHERETFAAVRAQQRRLAYGLARCGPVQKEGISKRFLSRVPLHYFMFLRLPVIYRRLRQDPELRSRFLRLLPRMMVAEWTLGLSALRYAPHRPALSGRRRPTFR
jgi:cellulose synthase/poly-beta-1,6-N-acetylglucosamine synthase-like glycosyltransferase